MGQGSDSCGAWEVEYDPYDEGIADGLWTCRDGSQIHISKMTMRHLQGALRVARSAQERANFTDSAEMWEEWVELFEQEIYRRDPTELMPVRVPSQPPKPVRGEKQWMKCHCGKIYAARTADIKRGYGFSCSKSCAAYRRIHKMSKAKQANPTAA
jgi:hypothetical protein